MRSKNIALNFFEVSAVNLRAGLHIQKSMNLLRQKLGKRSGFTVCRSAHGKQKKDGCICGSVNLL